MRKDQYFILKYHHYGNIYMAYPANVDPEKLFILMTKKSPLSQTHYGFIKKSGFSTVHLYDYSSEKWRKRLI